QGDDLRRLVGCGHVPENLAVRIVDPVTRRLCQDDVTGEVWVRGAGVARGYWGQAEATAERFGGYVADTGEGPFLRTNDLGFFRDDQLFVLGRMDDVIIVDGRNHHPQDIEVTVAESHPVL